MGRYTLYKHAIIFHAGLEKVPVYKHDDRDLYLYLSTKGGWSVSEVIGNDSSSLYQLPKNSESPSLTPSKSLPWQYSSGGWKDDATLKVNPCYLME